MANARRPSGPATEVSRAFSSATPNTSESLRLQQQRLQSQLLSQLQSQRPLPSAADPDPVATRANSHPPPPAFAASSLSSFSRLTINAPSTTAAHTSPLHAAGGPGGGAPSFVPSSGSPHAQPFLHSAARPTIWSPLSQPPSEWSVEAVQFWFENIEMGRYADDYRPNGKGEFTGFEGLDGRELDNLTEAQWLRRSPRRGDVLYNLWKQEAKFYDAVTSGEFLSTFVQKFLRNHITADASALYSSLESSLGTRPRTLTPDALSSLADPDDSSIYPPDPAAELSSSAFAASRFSQLPHSRPPPHTSSNSSTTLSFAAGGPTASRKGILSLSSFSSSHRSSDQIDGADEDTEDKEEERASYRPPSLRSPPPPLSSSLNQLPVMQNPAIFASIPPAWRDLPLEDKENLIKECFQKIGEKPSVTFFTAYSCSIRFVAWKDKELRDLVIADSGAGQDPRLRVAAGPVYVKFMLLLPRGMRQ